MDIHGRHSDFQLRRSHLRCQASNLRPRTLELQGFTLMELMVTIGIITILAGILLPAVSKSKASALAVRCQSNLKQFGVAMRMYVGDANFYPSASGESFPNTWQGQLMPYASSGNPSPTVERYSVSALLPIPELFRCSEYGLRARELIKDMGGNGSSAGSPFTLTVNDPVHKGAYGYNAWGTGDMIGKRYGITGSDGGMVFDGGTPQNTPILGLGLDCRDPLVVAPSEMISLGCLLGFDSWDRFLGPTGPNLLAEQHRGRGNVLACDGHVEAAKPANLNGRNDSARRRWNRDFEAHPESWQD